MYLTTKDLWWGQCTFQLPAKAIMTLASKLYTIVDPGYLPPARRRAWPAEELLGARCAAVDPNSHLGYRIRAGEWRQCATVAGIPAPANQVVVGNVVEKFF